MPGNKQSFKATCVTKTYDTHDIGSARTDWYSGRLLHAAEEGDADVVIVKKAIELGVHDDVVGIVDGTETIVLLMYHAHTPQRFYIKTKQHIIAIDAALQALRANTYLLHRHAMNTPLHSSEVRMLMRGHWLTYLGQLE